MIMITTTNREKPHFQNTKNVIAWMNVPWLNLENICNDKKLVAPTWKERNIGTKKW